ncbi:MAG: hypothetical protein ACAI38_14760 [Myxococcota bacterium]
MAERAADLPLFAPGTSGTAALQAFWDTYLGTAPPRDTPEYERYIDEAFARGVAHLREADIGHAPYPEKRMVQLTGEGGHPFNAFIRTLAETGMYVCFIPAHTEGKFAAGIVRRPNGGAVLVLGTRLMLELDPNAPSIAHERIHVVLPKAVGDSPHGATFTARDGSHLPGAPHWTYASHQAGDEPQAYLAGIVNALRKVATAARGDVADAKAPFQEAFRDVVAGLETALRNAATAKQVLAALRRGALTQLVGETLGPGVVAFSFTRRNGTGYDIDFRHGGLETALAADAALSRPGEVGPATRARLITHFEWQLRAAREELALYRVLGQAMSLATKLPELDARIIDAAIAVATTERAAVRDDAKPISYEEALSVFNERAASPA